MISPYLKGLLEDAGYTGSLHDAGMAYLKANGYTGQWNEEWFKWLVANGYVAPTLAEATKLFNENPALGGFDPSDLFSSGEAGIYYSFAEGTVFQDELFTTPATPGDTIGGVYDMSGNDIHLIQATLGLRPTLTAYGKVLFSGGQTLVGNANVDMGLSRVLTSSFGIEPTSLATRQDPLLFNAAVGSHTARAPRTTGPDLSFRGGTDAVDVNNFSILVVDTPEVLQSEMNLDGPSTKIRRNGTEIFSGTDSMGTTGWGSGPFYLGDSSATATTSPFNGYFYSMLLINRELAAQEKSDLDDFVTTAVAV